MKTANKSIKKEKLVSFAEMHREAMKDPEFRREYEALKPEYDLMCAIMDARLKKGMTQAEIARRAGTTQSAIARFESGKTNPTLDFASRILRAVGARLEVRPAR